MVKIQLMILLPPSLGGPERNLASEGGIPTRISDLRAAFLGIYNCPQRWLILRFSQNAIYLKLRGKPPNREFWSYW